MSFIAASHCSYDTASVISPVEQKVPIQLSVASTFQAGPGLSTPVLALKDRRGSTSPHAWAEVGRYRLRLAETAEDRDAACRLRFKVFHIELGGGLASSCQTGLDSDLFDPVCEYLLVENKLESDPARGPRATWAITPSRSSTLPLTSRSAPASSNWAASRSIANTALPKF